MPTERQPLFVECRKCGERWKMATLPVSCDILVKLKAYCPNCYEKKDIGVCHTDGPDKVTEARDGKPQE